VVGLKPGRGLVSLRGVHDLAPSLDTCGTLARSVAMAARGLAIISGADDGRTGRGFDAEAALAKPVAGARVAALPLHILGDVAPDVARLYLEALERLGGAGVTVEIVSPPQPLEAYFEPNGVLMAGEGWRVRGAHLSRNRGVMDPWVAKRFEGGRVIDDARLAAAQARRAQDQAAFHAWLSAYDGLVCPSSPITAPPLDEVDETTSPLSRLTRAANYLDLPAASLPCGLDSAGMPVGLQIMTGPADETMMVALASGFEAVSGWNGRAPDLAGFR
jgi:aspartyl-tRNA(Asn)/glutamyl-tRNA(Gln) amidotransferase subunit A